MAVIRNVGVMFVLMAIAINLCSCNNVLGSPSSGRVSQPSVPQPILHVEPVVLDFGTATTTQIFLISNTGAGTLTWSLAKDQPWISLNPVEGDTTTEIDEVVVEIDRSSFMPGESYVGTVKVSSDGGYQEVVVAAVSEPALQSTLHVEPVVLDFGTATTTQIFLISNTGAGTLTWSLAKDQPWISLNPVEGDTTTEIDEVVVEIDRSSFMPGESYVGTVKVSSDGGYQEVVVAAVSSEPAPHSNLHVDPVVLDFGTSSSTKTFAISNIGSGTLTWFITIDEPWITTSETEGDATYPEAVEIYVQVDRSSFIPGEVYVGTIKVSSGEDYQEVVVAASLFSGDKAKIETFSNKLTLHPDRDNLTEVKTTPFDDDDLPTMLADGIYRSKDNQDYHFQQRIEFNESAVFKHYADTDFKDKEPNLMVYGTRRQGFLYYTFDFVKSAESTNTSGILDDFEDSSITMLGKKYDITKAEISGTIVTLDLMGGAIKDILEQGETKTYILNDKNYEITITFIGYVGSTSKVKMVINGEVTNAMAKRDIYKLSDDTYVGVREIFEEEAGEPTGDMVEFYLGAEKLTLVDPVYSIIGYGDLNSDNVRLSDEDLDDLYVDIDASWNSDKLYINKIIFTWKPDNEIFIADGSEATFPGLESFKITYEGYTTGETEEIRIEHHGDNTIEMKVPLETGVVTFDLVSGSGTMFTSVGGEDYLLGTSGNGVINYDMDPMEYFIASNSAEGESYLLKVTRIDEDDGVTIKDQASGTYYRDLTEGTHMIGGVTLTLSDINETENSVTITNSDADGARYLFTKKGLAIRMPLLEEVVDQETYNLEFTEEDKDETLFGGASFNITLGWASSKAHVSDIPTTPFSSTNLFEIGDTEEYVGYIASDLGTKVYYDKDPDQDTAKLIYHDIQSYANAYIEELP